MPKKVLQVIDTPYRCTVEEQDEPAIWISHVLKGVGADIDVLLCGSAVNYAVNGQDASGLSFGGRKHSHPPTIDADVAKLVEKGVEVHVVEDDAGERGLERTDFVAGVKTVPRSGLSKLFARYDQVWHW